MTTPDLSTPRFASERELREWERAELETLQKDAAYALHPVNLMLAVAARITRARERFAAQGAHL